ncbi:MAG: transglutaminase family protein, partial [Planctomycetota bacterium]
MPIRVALHHKTSYQYDRAITLGPQVIRLRPAYHGRTPITSYSLDVQPEGHFLNWQQDPFANPIARCVFPQLVRSLSITVDLVAELTVINPFDFFIEDEFDLWPFEYEESLKQQLAPYLVKPTDGGELFHQWVDSMPKSADRIVDFLVAVNTLAQQRTDYLVRMEPGVQTPDETLEIGSGSCRDSAWLLVQTLRQIGLAARFVSGYLIQLKADQPSLDGPSGPQEDFCDLHAWTEVYVPGAGWIGLDPTSGLFAGEGHIPLACTPGFGSAAPITGGHEPCEVEFQHEMSVIRVHEDPRVTKPYSDSQWDAIMAAGHQVDEVLRAEDVRLTMGGEPTFVSIDNMEAPEWNSEAVGEEKRKLSNTLLLRLRDRFAPGGLLHYGQGKWYPGESLPRWALTCMWRRDGHPIWKNPQWLADESYDHQLTPNDARRFINHLSRRLGISARMKFPVYEDTLHYLWREGRLPVDVDPTDPKLNDPNERAMMIRTFQSGLGTPVGYVLPIRCAWWQSEDKRTWMGGRWPVRNDQVFLIPGESPVGLRLPLETLPKQGSENAAIESLPLDPTIPRGPLPYFHGDDGYRQPGPRQQLQLPAGNEHEVVRNGSDGSTFGGQGQYSGAGINPQVLDEPDDDEIPTDEDVVRTALVVECRGGMLYVFTPPVHSLEDYLDLISKVEQTCESLQLPVVIEGYLPPPDDRVELFKVTPDPGVIEVNTQPTESWEDLAELTETLYDEARLTRLGTEKFDVDGRHTGTGGGNHVVLGGKTPTDSPFLRRPDLLGSLIAFWNNHPSLSYLFSSRFVGPTSQAPRPDEGRRDAMYEMEIALSQLPDRGHSIQPWVVDRLFRDLLVDLTGNTHRSELCIDKLYSPDSSTGRLGLVELRGFEMPPHSQMSLAQQLLVRAAIASFWRHPYQRPLAHWGPRLHDRFLLPYFVWQDLGEVLNELRISGFDLNLEWFAPHHEFRFPRFGEVNYDGVNLEIRSAIEPWYVMGEEPGGGGTTRFVDSSVERMQLLVDGAQPGRHAVLCNGVLVPLHATGVEGQFVAGIRFRAWQPPRCLHPTIGVDSPLRFDLIDRFANRSIGGCTYFVSHPGGMSYETFPINANEAEARRNSRFTALGMTGGMVD